MRSASEDGAGLAGLPLFPLRQVLFPDGVLALKVFEARYLDLVGQCLRHEQPFGVVCLLQGAEVRAAGSAPVRFERVGVLARLTEVDADQAGVLQLRCLGTQRFRLQAQAVQRGDGLWQGDATLLERDACVPPTAALQPSVQALAAASAALQARGRTPFAQPYRFDEAGWVANRWGELLPWPLCDKQALMAQADPLQRLQRVQDWLRGSGVLSA